MGDNKNPFLFTTEKSVADKLITLGFTLLSNHNNNYMFINDSELEFDKDDDINILNKICFTNILCMA